MTAHRRDAERGPQGPRFAFGPASVSRRYGDGAVDAPGGTAGQIRKSSTMRSIVPVSSISKSAAPSPSTSACTTVMPPDWS